MIDPIKLRHLNRAKQSIERYTGAKIAFGAHVTSRRRKLPNRPPDRHIEERETFYWDIEDDDGRVYCGNCAALISSGYILTGPRRKHGKGFIVELSVGCTVCDAVMAWSVRCSRGGLPLERVVEAKLLPRAEALAWWKSHPWGLYRFQEGR